MKATLYSVLAFLLSVPLQGVLGTGDARSDSDTGWGDRRSVPQGFVTTEGTNFRLDNKNFVSNKPLSPRMS